MSEVTDALKALYDWKKFGSYAGTAVANLEGLLFQELKIITIETDRAAGEYYNTLGIINIDQHTRYEGKYARKYFTALVSTPSGSVLRYYPFHVEFVNTRIQTISMNTPHLIGTNSSGKIYFNEIAKPDWEIWYTDLIE